ncbi:MAG: FkbM family methyltransferase [Patescibacteria group bacterium]
MNKISFEFNNQDLELYCRDNIDQSVINEIFKFGEYRSAEETIRKAVEPILDVGAHAGFFSWYCRLLNSLVKIYSLEPAKENVNLFQKNYKLNHFKNITLIPAALAGQSGTRKMLVSADNINHRLISPDEKVVGGEITEVKAYSLAGLTNKFKINRFSLIKMDIEGGEYEVVASWQDQDWLKVSVLVLEYHNQDENSREILEQSLRQHGFSVQVFPSQFDKKLGFIFARNRR